jgi:hypothetical protein
MPLLIPVVSESSYNYQNGAVRNQLMDTEREVYVCWGLRVNLLSGWGTL